MGFLLDDTHVLGLTKCSLTRDGSRAFWNDLLLRKRGDNIHTGPLCAIQVTRTSTSGGGATALTASQMVGRMRVRLKILRLILGI